MKTNDRSLQQEKNDFLIFLRSHENPPREVKEITRNKIQALISPSIQTVFLKIFAIHFISALVSLRICHQFELNPFHVHQSVSDYLTETFGHYGCSFGGGLYFFSQTLIFAGFILTREEVRVLKKNLYSQITMLLLVSMMLLFVAGAKISFESTILIWVAGSIIGSLLTTKFIFKLKLA